MNFNKLYNLILENPDVCMGQHWKEGSRIFIVFPNGCIIWTANVMTHSNLMKGFKLLYQENIPWMERMSRKSKNHNNTVLQKDNSPKIYIKGVVAREMWKYEWEARSQAIFDGFLIGRTWDTDEWVSFWNPLWSFKSMPSLPKNLQIVVDELELHNYEFEFGEQQTYSKMNTLELVQYNKGTWNQTFHTTYPELKDFFKNDAAFQVQSSKLRNKPEILHTISPEKKGKEMKARKISPKIPIPLAQRMRERQGD